jgi:hypothetical protein
MAKVYEHKVYRKRNISDFSTYLLKLNLIYKKYKRKLKFQQTIYFYLLAEIKTYEHFVILRVRK